MQIVVGVVGCMSTGSLTGERNIEAAPSVVCPDEAVSRKDACRVALTAILAFFFWFKEVSPRRLARHTASPPI